MQRLKYMDLIAQQDSQMLQEYLTKLEKLSRINPLYIRFVQNW